MLRQGLVIVITREKIPRSVKRHAAVIARARRDDRESFSIWTKPKHSTAAGDAGAFRSVITSPVRPMIRAFEVAVGNDLIAAGIVDVALWPDRQPVHALMHVPVAHHGQAPDEPFRGNALALFYRAFEQINGGVGGDIEVIATDRDIINPRILREAEQQLARLVKPTYRWLINK